MYDDRLAESIDGWSDAKRGLPVEGKKKKKNSFMNQHAGSGLTRDKCVCALIRIYDKHTLGYSSDRIYSMQYICSMPTPASFECSMLRARFLVWHS